jgi:predicted esterase
MSLNFSNKVWNDKKVILGEQELDTQNPIRVVIGFHGAESTPENMLVHCSKLNIPNCLLVFPEGPIDADNGLWSWWKDGPKQKETVQSFVETSDIIFKQAKEYVLEKHENASTDFFAWGFSQGAAAVLVAVLFGSQPIKKAASVCGFLPELPGEASKSANPVPILGIFGANDEVVPSFLAEHALEEINQIGHQAQIKETPQGHEITSENLSEINQYFGN